MSYDILFLLNIGLEAMACVFYHHNPQWVSTLTLTVSVKVKGKQLKLPRNLALQEFLYIQKLYVFQKFLLSKIHGPNCQSRKKEYAIMHRFSFSTLTKKCSETNKQLIE